LTGLQGQFGRNQNGFESVHWHCCEHLRHHPVSAGVA
jgi:hypothetical protein